MTQQNRFLQRLDKGIVLGAEGYLFELERRGYLKAGAYVPEMVIEYPNAVRELHREFLRAGSKVIVAFTYYGHRAKMRAIGREGDLERLNRDAVHLAKDVAAEGDALVAGNVCNTWEYDPARHDETAAIVRPMFEELVRWAKEIGVDFIIAETFNHLGEAQIALEVIKEAGLPAMVTFAAKNEESYDNHTWAEACHILEDNGAEVVGPTTCLHEKQGGFAFNINDVKGLLAKVQGEGVSVISGGVGAFTADSFPVFDMMLPNVYVIADSNHGYKMIGVGKEVARVLMGEKCNVLHPFRFERFAEGDLHPVSNSPYPWSQAIYLGKG